MFAIRYGILIAEEYLGLIQYLNGGVRPKIENKKAYFMFEMNGDNTGTKNTEIRFEDDLYNKEGHLKEDTNILFP